jgi:hypothetical protein
MSVIEFGAELGELTYRQRWSHYFALIFGAVGMVIGINLRDSVINATWLYTNAQAGITAQYPQNWLIDELPGEYVFRVRNASEIGFKTTFQVAVVPVGPGSSVRTILDGLSLNRASILTGYNAFPREEFILPDETPASAMTYTFVAAESSPFLESLPVVVEGLDILTIQRGQAIVITFRSDSRTFDDNYPLFEQFLNTLDF